MGRKRSFDPEVALDQAMRLFWQRGYAETSVRDLVKATGLAHASLYGTFGDKEALFAAALRRYVELVWLRMEKDLRGAEPGLGAIRAFFERIVQGAIDGVFLSGCFICNSATELGGKDHPATGYIQEQLRSRAQLLDRSVAAAQEQGEIAAELSTEDVTDALMMTFVGAAVLLRAGAPPQRLARAAEVTLMSFA